jgi:kinesin family protein 5
VGQEEVVIESFEDIMKVASVVETERAARQTKMNMCSSRSHALLELKSYRKEGDDKLFMHSLSFFDLAGAERPDKANVSAFQDPKSNNWQLIEAITINFSLYLLSRVIDHLAGMKKPLTGGAAIPAGCGYKEQALTRCLSSSWNGGAFTTFLFCVSMHERNQGETFNTLKMS